MTVEAVIAERRSHPLRSPYPSPEHTHARDQQDRRVRGTTPPHEAREPDWGEGDDVGERELVHGRPPYGPPHRYRPRAVARRRRGALLALILLAAVIGAIVALTRGSSSANALAISYTRAWAHGNYGSMYADLDAPSQARVSSTAFAHAYAAAAVTATTTGIVPSKHVQDESGDIVAVPVRVHTYLFGTLQGKLRVHVRSESTGTRGRLERIAALPWHAPR